MEIITGVERRRRWRLEDKLRMLAELDEPGMSVAAVARRHEVSRGLLHHWRRQFRKGALTELPQLHFVPLEIVEAVTPEPPPGPMSAKAGRSLKRGGMMEIELGDGRRVRVDRDVDGDALRRVIEALAPR
jgi:transposase-like protein